MLKKSDAALAHIALVIAMIVWGSSFVALKVSIAAISPMWVVFLRMSIGAATLLLLWKLWYTKPDYRPGDWKFLIGLALLEPCLYFIFEAQAMMYTSAGQAGMIVATLPLMVAAGAYFFLHEKTTHAQWLGFSIALAGVLLMTVTGTETEQAPNALLGNFLEFLAMSCAVGYILLVKHLVQRYSSFFLTAMQSFIGTLFFFPLAMTEPMPTEISPEIWGILLYLGIVVTLGAYGLYNYSMSQVSASVAASYTNLLPAFSLIFSMTLLNEHILPVQWFSIALIFVGVGWSQKGPPEQKGAVAEAQSPA